MECKVVIPTKGRARTMVAHKYVSNAIVCVAESEVDQYKEVNPDVEYAVHPDSVVGLVAKRNWIYEKFRNVFMIDDDIKGFARLTAKRKEGARISPELAYHLIQNAANLAKISGVYLFGFNNLKRPEFYSGHNPYRLTGCINGCCFGILEGADKLQIDKDIKLAYEYYISGINAYYYRRAFFDLRYCFVQDGYADATGGAAYMRTLDIEKRDLEILKSHFGPAIVERANKGKNVKCEFSKYLKIPF